MSNLSPVSKLEVQYDRQLVMDLSKVQSKVSGRGRQLGIVIAALFSLLFINRMQPTPSITYRIQTSFCANLT